MIERLVFKVVYVFASSLCVHTSYIKITNMSLNKTLLSCSKKKRENKIIFLVFFWCCCFFKTVFFLAIRLHSLCFDWFTHGAKGVTSGPLCANFFCMETKVVATQTILLLTYFKQLWYRTTWWCYTCTCIPNIKAHWALWFQTWF